MPSQATSWEEHRCWPRPRLVPQPVLLPAADHPRRRERELAVDLVETFNRLLGLAVRRSTPSRRRAVEGISPAGERVLILWRDMDRMPVSQLAAWLRKHRARFGPTIDRVYVNGADALEVLRPRGKSSGKRCRSRRSFRRLLFEGTDA